MGDNSRRVCHPLLDLPHQGDCVVVMKWQDIPTDIGARKGEIPELYIAIEGRTTEASRHEFELSVRRQFIATSKNGLCISKLHPVSAIRAGLIEHRINAYAKTRGRVSTLFGVIVLLRSRSGVNE